MSTAAVSSLSILQELQSFYQTRQTDLKQLGAALQNGDLATAQQAYSALQSLGQNGPFSNSQAFSNTKRAQAFAALGQALQSGNLAGEQSAFAALTSKTNNYAPATDATPAAIVNLSGSQPGASSQSGAVAPTSSSIFQQLHAFRQQRASNLAQLGQDLQSGNLTAAQSDVNALTALGQSGPYKNGASFGAANREQDFQAIGQALQSGDLAGAQSAFANLASTFGRQNQQAQNAISAYNSGVAEIVINFNPPSVPPASSGSASTSVELPVAEPPASATPEIVINLGGTAGASSAPTSSQGAQPELVINLGQNSGSPSGNISEIDINFGAPSTSATAAQIPEILINLPQGSSSTGGAGEQVTINFGNSNSGPEISIGAPQSQSTTPSEQVTLNLAQNTNYELILNLLNGSSGQNQTSSGNAVSVHA
jgi:Skp family chaperone for outer membrane proteins